MATFLFFPAVYFSIRKSNQRSYSSAARGAQISTFRVWGYFAFRLRRGLGFCTPSSSVFTFAFVFVFAVSLAVFLVVFLVVLRLDFGFGFWFGLLHLLLWWLHLFLPLFLLIDCRGNREGKSPPQNRHRVHRVRRSAPIRWCRLRQCGAGAETFRRSCGQSVDQMRPAHGKARGNAASPARG